MSTLQRGPSAQVLLKYAANEDEEDPGAKGGSERTSERERRERGRERGKERDGDSR